VDSIPQNLLASMTVASVSFFLAVWLLIHMFYKKSSVSFRMLGALVIWYGLVYFLGKAGKIKIK
jgi:hypothetical protein